MRGLTHLRRLTMRPLLLLTLLVFGTSNVAFALNEDAALALHLLPVTINGICTRAAAHPACGSIITSGRLSPSTYFAYVLITGAAAHRGLAGVEFGIDYAGAPSGGVDIFDWRHCATLQFPSDGWPGAGSGNLITWDKEAACQREEPGGAGSGVVATVGYFYLTAYTPDQLTLTVRPVSGAARIADCDAVEYPVEGPGVSHPLPHLGYVTFSADGLTPGYNPCTALTTPLTCGISGPASVPGNSRGTLYTVAASQPGATFDWQISGSGTLTVLAPGNKALVDTGGDGAFTLDVGTDGNGAHSSCRKVVTVIPGACAVNGPGTLPSGTTGQYQIGGVADGAAIQWSLFGSGTLVGPTNGSDVVVIAGTPGLMTLKAAVTVAAVTDTCSRRIEVTPGSCAVLGPDIVLAGAPGITYTAATDATGGRYSWNVVGDATVTEGGDDTPTIVLAAGESGGFTVSVTITGDGPERTCGRQVSIISAGPCQPGRNGRAKLLLNLVPAPAGAPCGRPNAAPNCSNVRTNGALFPQHYFAFLMVAQGEATYGVGGLQCGIRY